MLEEYNNLIQSLLSVLRPHSVCLLYTDTSETTDSSPLYSITVVITAVTFGMAVFSCVLLLAAICYCVIMMRKKTLKPYTMGYSVTDDTRKGKGCQSQFLYSQIWRRTNIITWQYTNSLHAVLCLLAGLCSIKYQRITCLHLLLGVFWLTARDRQWTGQYKVTNTSFLYFSFQIQAATATCTSSPLAASTRSYDFAVDAGVQYTITVSALSNDRENHTLITCHTCQRVVSSPAVHKARQLQLHTLLPTQKMLQLCRTGGVAWCQPAILEL